MDIAIRATVTFVALYLLVARLVLRLKKGEHLEEDGVHYLQLPRIHIETETPVTVNVDGEPQGTPRYFHQTGSCLVEPPQRRPQAPLCVIFRDVGPQSASREDPGRPVTEAQEGHQTLHSRG